MEANNTPTELFTAAELAALDELAEMTAEEFWGLDQE